MKLYAQILASQSKHRRWVPKTPAQVVFKEKKVESLKEELKREERELVKLPQAKKIFEGTT